MRDWNDVSRHLQTQFEVNSGRLQALLQLSDNTGNNKDAACCTLAGTFAFGSTLAVSTFIQWQVLKISTGSPPPMPTLVGLATVCVASLASRQAALSVYEYRQRVRGEEFLNSLLTFESPSDINLHQIKSRIDRISNEIKSNKELQKLFDYKIYIERLENMLAEGGKKPDFDIFKPQQKSTWKQNKPWHVYTTTTLLGLVVFRFVLGGRFWAIAPSSLTHIGSFARASLPATEAYATTTQRQQLETLGRRFGCHTCGSKQRMSRLFRRSTHFFVGDHMPPKSVAIQLSKRWDNVLKHRIKSFVLRRPVGDAIVPFKFYPQCVPCSQKQGSVLSKATNKLRQAQNSWYLLSSRKTGAKNFARQLHRAGGGTRAHYHGLTPRWNHWTGGLIGYWTYKCCQDEEYKDIKTVVQTRVRNAVKDAENWIEKYQSSRRR